MHGHTASYMHTNMQVHVHTHSCTYSKQRKSKPKNHKSKRKANWDERDQQRREWDQGGQWELGIIKIYHTSMETKQNTKFSIINVY